ncbi:HlyD family secretion protein [Ancylobacter terrae]|uniref:HlyD family secretion protein n=1 Tax=Ancylobacter sp. sgz301288 TaxID=3342077 RepID=UPI00385F7BCA
MLDRTKNIPPDDDLADDDLADVEAPAAALAPAVVAADPAGSAGAPAAAPTRKRRLRTLLMAGGILVVALGSGYAWLSGGRYVSTDDAYVRAPKLMVSTDVSGLVADVDVKEGQQVKAGDVLFRVDPRQYEIALENARATMAETALAVKAMKVDYGRMQSDIAAQQASVQNDQATFDRYNVLVKDNSISKANFDQARFALEADQRKLESLKQQAEVQLARLGGTPDLPVEQHPQYLQAKAAVDEAQRQLDHATVRAPFDGTVTAVDSLQPGLYLVAQTAALTNQGAVALVSSDDLWIDAHLKETDLTFVKPGDPVDVSVDSYPGHVWHGTVESLSPASGSEFSILPAQNASGNWVKVVQRVTARVRLDHGSDDPVLRAGMSVVVDIDTGHRRSLAEMF